MLKTRTLLFLILVSFAFLGSCTGAKKEKPLVGPELKLALEHPIKSLDPHKTKSSESLRVVSLIFDTLLEFDYSKRPYEIKERLVEALPTVSADQQVLRFKLKKNQKFEQNLELTSDDVIYSLKRMVDPHLKPETSWIFEGKILGLKKWRTLQVNAGQTDYNLEVEGLKKIDSHTFEVHLIQKFPQLMQLLAMPQTAIVPKKLFLGAEEIGLNLQYLKGSGPYKIISENEGGKSFYLARKDSETLREAKSKNPLFVSMKSYENGDTKWKAFLDEKLDLIQLPLALVPKVLNTKTLELNEAYLEKQYQIHQSTQLETEYLAFNLKDPFIKKAGAKFRRAVALALDKQEIINKFYGESAVVAESAVPPGLFGYDQSYKSGHSEFNLEKAKKLLAEAGYPEGKGVPTLKHEYLSNQFVQKNAEYFQSSMKKIGINVELVHNTEAEFFRKIRNDRAQIWRISWIYDYPDAENFLQVFYGPNSEGSGPNSANYQNEEFDKKYEKMRAMFDVPDKLDLLNKMKQILNKDLPWVPLLHKVDYFLSHQYVEGFHPGYLGGSSARWVKVKKISENSKN